MLAGKVVVVTGASAGIGAAIAAHCAALKARLLLTGRSAPRGEAIVTAMVTSVRLVEKNPWTMLAWCAFIGICMGLSILSAFFGLLVLLPIIGHATWHLYRRAVAPAAPKVLAAPGANGEPSASTPE